MVIKCYYCHKDLDLGVYYEKKFPHARFFHVECKQQAVEDVITNKVKQKKRKV